MSFSRATDQDNMPNHELEIFAVIPTDHTDNKVPNDARVMINLTKASNRIVLEPVQAEMMAVKLIREANNARLILSGKLSPKGD